MEGGGSMEFVPAGVMVSNQNGNINNRQFPTAFQGSEDCFKMCEMTESLATETCRKLPISLPRSPCVAHSALGCKILNRNAIFIHF